MSPSRMTAASPCTSWLWWRSIDGGDRHRQAPAAGEHAAHERMVDAELAALLVDAFLGRPGAAMHLGGIARVGVQQHELADVVQRLVTVRRSRCSSPTSEAILSAAFWVARACRRKRSGAASQTLARSKKSNVRTRLASACTVGRLEQLDGSGGGVDAPAGPLHLVCQAQHRDRERDIGLDRGHDVGRRHMVLGGDGEQAIARLGERGKGLERFEGRRQAPAVALVLVALTGARRCARALVGRRTPRRAWAAPPAASAAAFRVLGLVFETVADIARIPSLGSPTILVVARVGVLSAAAGETLSG